MSSDALPSLPLDVLRVIEWMYDTEFEDLDGRKVASGGQPLQCECRSAATVYLEEKPARSIDWGLGDGTFCATFAGCRKSLQLQGRHVTLDPFQTSLSRQKGLINLRRCSVDNHVEFHEVTSEAFLVGERNRGAGFDFVFVDGGHSQGQKMTDAFLADKVLLPGGVLGFHDAFFLSTSLAARYLVDDLRYEPIRLKMPLDPRWKSLARAAKHSARLGLRYATRLAPFVAKSLLFLRKPSGTPATR